MGGIVDRGDESAGLATPLNGALTVENYLADHCLEQPLEDLEYLTFAAQPVASEVSAVEASPPACA